MTGTHLGNTQTLGGPFNGHSPKQTISNYKDGDQVLIRKQLRVAWNTSQATGTVQGKKRIITPFRAVNNSGDFLSRQNYVCGGHNPSSIYRGGISRRFGSILSNQCDGSNIQSATTNVKFVPDSSDYVRFRKQSAMNKNYNDLTYGGDGRAQSIMRLK